MPHPEMLSESAGGTGDQTGVRCTPVLISLIPVTTFSNDKFFVPPSGAQDLLLALYSGSLLLGSEDLMVWKEP